MASGFVGRILRVDLTNGRLSIESPPEIFYRTYFGGRGFIAHYLLEELEPGVDPLGPENILVFATGVMSGGPFGGSGRNSVGAKSPLTGGFGEAEVGGFFGAELKFAGFDAIIVEGESAQPTYLWIHDGTAELRDARRLWGKSTAESQTLIRAELRDDKIRTAQIGPAGENQVLFANVINDLRHAAGRSGLGAVMGSKKLKAVAVRGTNRVEVADKQLVKELANWVVELRRQGKDMYELGTPGVVLPLNANDGLPTRNWQEGVFEGAETLSGEHMNSTGLLVDRGNCYACPVYCKRVCQAEEPYQVDPEYGGPEYETIAALGSCCGVSDLVAVSKGHELCNRAGLDTIGAGTTIAWAMECYERGILTDQDTGGLALRFGDADVMLQLLNMIIHRENFGDVLAKGVKRASEQIGRGSEQYAMHVKGQEFPMHEPRFKQGMGFGYLTSPTGADHVQSIHDDDFAAPCPALEGTKAFGVLEPLPIEDLSPAKVRLHFYRQLWWGFCNHAVVCIFPGYDFNQLVDLARGMTGWNCSGWEIGKVAERGITMARAFNVREGLGRKDDSYPARMFEPLPSGPRQGHRVDPDKVESALDDYYGMLGWDPEGVPTRAKLEELNVGWVYATMIGGGK